MAERTYDVRWVRLALLGRPVDGEIMECKQLTPRVALARLMGAIENSGPIAVLSITPSPKED